MGQTIKFDNKDLCQVCHKRKGTRLCDYIILEQGPTFVCGSWIKQRQQNNAPMTCDELLCDHCSTCFGNMDFCPGHAVQFKK